MNFSIKQSLLIEALNVTGKCLDSKTSIASTGSYLFAINNDTVTITATDISTSLSYTIDILSNNVQAKITIPGERIRNLISALPEQFLEFTVEKNPDIKSVAALFLKIKTANGEYEMPADDGENFPVIKMEPEANFLLRKQDLCSGIDRTTFACLKDRESTDFILTGVSMSFDSGCVRFTATNKHICSTFSYATDVASDNRFNIPAKAMAILRAIPMEDEVNVRISERCISFSLSEGIVFTCMLIHGAYPDVKRVIPSNNPNEATTDRIQFLGALKRVGQFADSVTRGVRLDVKERSITLSARNDHGERAHETIEATLSGAEISISLSVYYLMETLSKFEKEHVTLILPDSLKGTTLITENPFDKEEKANLVFLAPLKIDAGG